MICNDIAELFPPRGNDYHWTTVSDNGHADLNQTNKFPFTASKFFNHQCILENPVLLTP